jgi:hypothetical protein
MLPFSKEACLILTISITLIFSFLFCFLYQPVNQSNNKTNGYTGRGKNRYIAKSKAVVVIAGKANGSAQRHTGNAAP